MSWVHLRCIITALFRNCMQHIWVILQKATYLLELLVINHDSKMDISSPFEVNDNDFITVQFIFWIFMSIVPRWVGVLVRLCDYCGRMAASKSIPMILQKYIKLLRKFVWYHSYAVHSKIWFRKWWSLNKNNTCETIQWIVYVYAHIWYVHTYVYTH